LNICLEGVNVSANGENKPETQSSFDIPPSRELGIDLLKATVDKPQMLLARLCARCAASMAEINHLHGNVSNRCKFPR
jgi:hypothetical protein